jgi:hypothetical protein
MTGISYFRGLVGGTNQGGTERSGQNLPVTNENISRWYEAVEDIPSRC